MYYVRVKNQVVASGHIDESPRCPELTRLQSHAASSVTIQLDGDELERVLRWGYPNHGGAPVQIYIGETALQIIANWS